MLVLTWNIQKRVRQLGGVTRAIGSREPDIVTLQEVAEGALAGLNEDLGQMGLVYSVPSLARGKGNLILSRWPLRAHAPGWAGQAPDLPFPELLTGATVDTPSGSTEIITAHMPNGSANGEKKVAHFRALAHHLARRAPGPCVLTGDFNSPRFESEGGTVVCFGGSYKNRGQAWEEAEQAIITGTAKFGMRDVFREKHGYKGSVGGDAYSHQTPGHDRRLDHIFASDELKVTEAQYEMDWLKNRLSDHAALWARFAA